MIEGKCIISRSSDNHAVLVSVNSVVGNILNDKRLAQTYRRMKAAGLSERLLVSRMEMERTRLRRKTNKGTDIGIVLKPDEKIHNGDVLLSNQNKFVTVEQMPEKVLSVTIKDRKTIELAVLIGHAIGNRHRPIAVNDGIISFPIQVESEAEIFGKLLKPLGNIEIKIEERIFQPSVQESHTHEH